MDEATKKKGERGLRNEDLGVLVGEKLGAGPVDESRVSRCLTGDTATSELVDAISEVLKIPPPFFLAESLPEALQMAGVRATFSAGRTEQKIDAASAKVTKARATIAKVRSVARSVADRHTSAIRSTHGAKGLDGVGTDARRRGAGRS